MHRGRFEQLKSFPVYHRDTLLHRKLGILYIAICQDTSDMDFKIHFLMMPASKCLISRRWRTLGLYSLSRWTSYRMMSSSLEAARFGFRLLQSPRKFTGTSTASLPRCLSNCRVIPWLQHPISRLRDFTRCGGKTSYCWVNRGPGSKRSYCCDIHHCITKCHLEDISMFHQDPTEVLNIY